LVLDGEIEIDHIIDPITWENVSGGSTDALEDGMTWEHNITCGDNMVLIVGIAVDSEPTALVDTITYDSVSLSKVNSTSSSDGEEQAEMWNLTNPNCGSSKTINVTFTNPTAEEAAGISSVYYDVDFINLSSINAASSDGSTSSTLNVSSSSADNWVVNVFALDVDAGSDISVSGDNAVQRGYEDQGYATVAIADGNDTDGTVTMGWSGFNDEWAQVGVELIWLDTDAPVITIQHPLNDTYGGSVWFNVTLDKTGSWCGYSLDGAANVTMDGSGMTWYKENTTMTGGSHNVTFSCNDTLGNMNASSVIEYFTVDLIYPQYSLNQTDSIEAGSYVLFSLYWEDNYDLAGYIFSFNNGTGTFENDSYVEMTGDGNWSNVTKSVNSTVGVTIQWQVYANDTIGNMNTSQTYSFETTDTTPPVITVQSPLNGTCGGSVWFNVTLDETGSWCGYSLDGAANVTMDGSGTTWYKENSTMTIGSHNVTFSCNDTLGNMNASSVTEYFTVDTILPDIYFVQPTPNNGNITGNNYAYINVTTNDTNNITAFIDWNNSLVGWWRFNEEIGENSTFFRDWSTYGNNGTNGSNPVYTIDGKFGKALNFDGSDDYVDCGNDSSLNITGEITLEVWVKAAEPQWNNAKQKILSKWGHATTAEFQDTVDWDVYDAENEDGANDMKGFRGAVFDGRYIYFNPSFNGIVYSGKVLRY
ncbi:MAG: hypothetical protein KAR23_03890, partial [Candidatus Aenigmarchaeota archaeon]|nr:hypothetical protein [Candidatus Aenigmarchaeota archaeon]